MSSGIFFDQRGQYRPRQLVRDRDGKFAPEFCSILESAGIQFRTTPRRSPNMNPFAESWVGSIKQECLDHFIVFGEEHLKYLVDEYVAHYNEERPHQGLGNRRQSETEPTPEILQFNPDEIVCRERLGGLLKHYERKAA